MFFMDSILSSKLFLERWGLLLQQFKSTKSIFHVKKGQFSFKKGAEHIITIEKFNFKRKYCVAYLRPTKFALYKVELECE